MANLGLGAIENTAQIEDMVATSQLEDVADKFKEMAKVPESPTKVKNNGFMQKAKVLAKKGKMSI